MSAVKVHPLVSPWGRFGLYSFFIDAPEPAIVDTGIASSPAEGLVPALEAIGRKIEDVRWILLTHGHIDHVGGAHALWELTGRRTQVVIHEADAPMLRSRRAHVDEYLAGRGRYLNDAEGEAKVTAAADAVISGEMEPTMLVEGGETISLGGDVTVSATRPRPQPPSDEHNTLLPPDAYHLPVGRPVTHKIYRDAAHPSRLLLPFTTRTAIENS